MREIHKIKSRTLIKDSIMMRLNNLPSNGIFILLIFIALNARFIYADDAATTTTTTTPEPGNNHFSFILSVEQEREREKNCKAETS